MQVVLAVRGDQLLTSDPDDLLHILAAREVDATVVTV
jgi:hypothetical protein